MQHSMNIERENQKVQNCTVYNAWTRGRAESIELYRIQCMDKRKSRKYRIVQNTMHVQEEEQKVQNCTEYYAWTRGRAESIEL